MCSLRGKCPIDPNAEIFQILPNINEDDCHAKAEVEFKRCGNGKENPITATYFGWGGNGPQITSVSFPKSTGSRTWI